MSLRARVTAGRPLGTRDAFSWQCKLSMLFSLAGVGIDLKAFRLLGTCQPVPSSVILMAPST